jgi:Sec-independent protein translocase protein TatA
MNNQLLSELKLLVSLKHPSLKSNRICEKFFLLAFAQPKPLFDSNDKLEAEILSEKSVPIFRESFKSLRVRLEPDFIDFAQRYCSGFQFLLDELKFFPEELPQILEGVKEFIKNCKEFGAEKDSKPITEEELAEVPQSHWWMFVKKIENQEEEEEEDSDGDKRDNERTRIDVEK